MFMLQQKKKDYDVQDFFYDVLDQLVDEFSNHDRRLVLRGFNDKIEKENSFRLTKYKHTLHEVCNDNSRRVINFATDKNLIVKSTCFPRLIH